MTMTVRPTVRETTVLLKGLAEIRDTLSPEMREQADRLLRGERNIHELSGPDHEAYHVALQRFLFVNDQGSILQRAGVSHAYNLRAGYPQAPQSVNGGATSSLLDERWTLFGRPLGFPIGVPASVLTADSRWLAYFAQHGFNVLTFKTVRTRRTRPLDFPNWVFLEDADAPLPLDVDTRTLVLHGNTDTYLRSLRAFSAANSFGVPSDDPEVWRSELQKALALLGDGQYLIVSVMGTSGDDDEFAALRDDFVQAAIQAVDGGAPAVELNLSCPNTADHALDDGVKPPLCESVGDTAEVVKAVHQAIGDRVPVIAKLGYLPFPTLRLMVQEISPYVAAISGINTLQVRVETPRGAPTFGNRKLAGVSGIAIRHLALDFVRSLKVLRDESPHSYAIIGMGGVMEPLDVHALMAVGADAVQTATAAHVNPNLPRDIVSGLNGDAYRDADELERVRSVLYATDGHFRSSTEIADLLEIAPEALEAGNATDLDLPRRVFELIVLGEDVTPTRPVSWPWGTSPSRMDLVEIDELSERLLEQQQQRLVRRSLSIEGFAALMKMSVADAQRLIIDGDIIYFDWGGRKLLPAWQIDDSAAEPELLPGLRELRRAFARDVVALDDWIMSPQSAFDGSSPRDLLIDGQVARVVDAIASVGAAV
jgi:dihydroorotate dehydrogenase